MPKTPLCCLFENAENLPWQNASSLLGGPNRIDNAVVEAHGTLVFLAHRQLCCKGIFDGRSMENASPPTIEFMFRRVTFGEKGREPLGHFRNGDSSLPTHFFPLLAVSKNFKIISLLLFFFSEAALVERKQVQSGNIKRQKRKRSMCMERRPASSRHRARSPPPSRAPA